MSIEELLAEAEHWGALFDGARRAAAAAYAADDWEAIRRALADEDRCLESLRRCSALIAQAVAA